MDSEFRQFVAPNRAVASISFVFGEVLAARP
jgi:hypothetical protein